MWHLEEPWVVIWNDKIVAFVVFTEIESYSKTYFHGHSGKDVEMSSSFCWNSLYSWQVWHEIIVHLSPTESHGHLTDDLPSLYTSLVPDIHCVFFSDCWMMILFPHMSKPSASDSSFFTFMYALTVSGAFPLCSGHLTQTSLTTDCRSPSAAIAILMLSIVLGYAGMPRMFVGFRTGSRLRLLISGTNCLWSDSSLNSSKLHRYLSKGQMLARHSFSIYT